MTAMNKKIDTYMRIYKLKRYCSQLEDIENYELAKADNFIGWDIHHRLETHNSDGERRPIDLTRFELQALDVYYNRPASELIFLKHGDHMRLHKNGKPMSEETRVKMSTSHLGSHFSDETRAKISAARHGKHYSAETRAKMSTSHRGKHLSDETRAKMSAAAKHRAPVSAETKAERCAAC
jgi:hypothetical protein